MKRKSVLGKMVILGIVGAFAALTLATPALAQDANVLKESSKMMSDGWKMFEEGQSTVIKGLEMNNQIAAKLGFQELMNPGNKTIGLGRDSVFTGAKSFAQGTKVVMEASDPKVMKEGVDMLRNGFKIAIGGKETMEKGIAMNNDLAKSKGALDKFAQGDEIMKTGMATMKEGINLFLKGEKLYLGAK